MGLLRFGIRADRCVVEDLWTLVLDINGIMCVS